MINSGIEGALVACVAMSPLVREKLCPALLHTYCSVDIVEGLDVDKEEFDKFSARCEHCDINCCHKYCVLNITSTLLGCHVKGCKSQPKSVRYLREILEIMDS